MLNTGRRHHISYTNLAAVLGTTTHTLKNVLKVGSDEAAANL